MTKKKRLFTEEELTNKDNYYHSFRIREVFFFFLSLISFSFSFFFYHFYFRLNCLFL